MRFPLTEPLSPRYIHINPTTNLIHLLMPFVEGQEIGTDNTCKTTTAIQEFFDNAAFKELEAYKKALKLDIRLLGKDNPESRLKEERLVQIDIYLHALRAMQWGYGHAIIKLISKPSNLYSIQLRPREQDPESLVIAPVFSIERRNDSSGTPLSALYRALHRVLPNIRATVHSPRDKLIASVLNTLPSCPQFTDIQDVLSKQCQRLFGLEINFTQDEKKMIVDQKSIDGLMGFGKELRPTEEDYIEALLGICAPDLSACIPTPPFSSIPVKTSLDERTEHFSILTQFFLAHVNIYCHSHSISTHNFGIILDKSPDLSDELAVIVLKALESGESAEECICLFFNTHASEFALSRPLTTEEMKTIQKKFEKNYRSVTATKENPHMDDFIVLNIEATGGIAKFVSHQGSICINFAEVIDPALANQRYFARIREDFTTHPMEIPHKNIWISGEVDIELETLITTINDAQLKTLPTEVQEACKTHPSFKIRQFLHAVAKGKQEIAEAFLTESTCSRQLLLSSSGVFTDYSGRTFYCTAYEYAYWAKDIHMCLMLDRHMDDATKTIILDRINEMERIDEGTGRFIGLAYEQHGEEQRSMHFDLKPLKLALEWYIYNYNNRKTSGTNDTLDQAWIEIGIAQRDVPAHVAQEYCIPGRPFQPLPGFNERFLPRIFTVSVYSTDHNLSWYPLDTGNFFALGFNFTVLRGDHTTEAQAYFDCGTEEENMISAQRVHYDLMAMTRLDEVRTAELKLLREHLSPAPYISSLSI